MRETPLESVFRQLGSTPAGRVVLLVLLVLAMFSGVALFFALLALFNEWVIKAALLCLIVICYTMYREIHVNREAFRWRKRWIVERFGAGVEGKAGDYFVTTSYSNGVPCIIFAVRRDKLETTNSPIRHWNNLMGHDLLGDDSDLPDEKTIGLPENPAKDRRPWIPVGPGLCMVPPAVIERASM